MCVSPRRHMSHRRQGVAGSTATRSPGRSGLPPPETAPGPHTETTAANSCPRTSGVGRGPAEVRAWLYIWRSLPQIPAAVSATVTSPSPGGGGGGISSTRRSRGPWRRTPVISSDVLARVGNGLRVVGGDVRYPDEAHRIEKRPPRMRERHGRVVGEPLLQEHVPVEPPHLPHGEDRDAAERFRVDVQDLPLRDV